MKTNFLGKIVSLASRFFRPEQKPSPTFQLFSGDGFLPQLAHELRTPLHSIIAQTELLLQHNHPQLPDQSLTILHNAASYALALSNQCLQLSKLQSGRMELTPRSIDLLAVLRKVSGYVEHHSSGNRPLITCFPDVPHEYVCADETVLQQILCNLLNNAFQAASEGPVTFSATLKPIACEKLLVSFIIEDEGPGIPDTLLNRIFEPFTQANPGKPGSGLGLAICHELIQLMNGSIKVENKAEKGARFTITLALPMATPVEQPDRPSHSLLQGIRVLLVDDNPVNLLLARKTLEQWSCTVNEAPTAMEALDLFNQNTYDVLLIDLDLPDLQGRELLSFIRKMDSDIPAIAFTATLQEDLDGPLKQAGFSAFISKPFRSGDLYKKILQHTEIGRLQYQKYA
jgi:CheY-like chemotaxis protein/anti-sigma regulatory factor (Ser/Thr protein kinase)